MYSEGLGLLLLSGAVFVWLSVISFLVWKQGNFLDKLFPNSGERDIRKKFEEILNKVEGFKGQLNETNEVISELHRQGLKYIQKVEILRFNPYDDTGGDISFAVTFLDKNGDGIVLTSLHSRSGTRVFAKPVKQGKEGEYKFSKEEKEVVQKAYANNRNS